MAKRGQPALSTVEIAGAQRLYPLGTGQDCPRALLRIAHVGSSGRVVCSFLISIALGEAEDEVADDVALDFRRARFDRVASMRR